MSTTTAFIFLVFTARRYASAVCAVIESLSVSVCLLLLLLSQHKHGREFREIQAN